MKPETSLFSALAAVFGNRAVPPGSGLAGPAFPAPTSLEESGRLVSASTSFDTLINESPAIQANETAWAVSVFSTTSDKPLYERFNTPDYDVGVDEVDKDSVFRIASVSKVFSVWTFLMEVGDAHLNEPITRYVPELATTSNSSAPDTVYDDIDHVRWDEVTLGQLASHLAGIPRDPAQTDMSAGMRPEQAMALGLPPVPEDDIPVCGVTGLLRTCSRSEMIHQLLKQHPIYPTGHSPAYSNVAYALLGYAQEAITGTPPGDAITSNIFTALDMTSSSFSIKPQSGGVVPGDESAVGWSHDLGETSPSGGIYASTADMVKAGRAILGSKTMTPAQSRKWLKPFSQTGVLGSAVGAPWEIRHLMLEGRLTQLYTKQGDIRGYRTAFVLSPDHEIGAIVFSAGPVESNSAVVRETLMNAVGRVFLPMAESQARDEARDNFAGTFVDEATNSSVTIEIDQHSSSLVVRSLKSLGVEVIGLTSPFIEVYGAGQSARLFPTGLKTIRRTDNRQSTYLSRVGFRASFFNATGGINEVQDPGLTQWTSLGAPTYGARTLDDWVVTIGEDGKAKAVDVRMLRLNLIRLD